MPWKSFPGLGSGFIMNSDVTDAWFFLHGSLLRPIFSIHKASPLLVLLHLSELANLCKAVSKSLTSQHAQSPSQLPRPKYRRFPLSKFIHPLSQCISLRLWVLL